jgi:hypothetical protein
MLIWGTNAGAFTVTLEKNKRQVSTTRRLIDDRAKTIGQAI